jgi:hypothetical protein
METLKGNVFRYLLKLAVYKNKKQPFNFLNVVSYFEKLFYFFYV